MQFYLGRFYPKRWFKTDGDPAFVCWYCHRPRSPYRLCRCIYDQGESGRPAKKKVEDNLPTDTRRKKKFEEYMQWRKNLPGEARKGACRLDYNRWVKTRNGHAYRCEKCYTAYVLCEARRKQCKTSAVATTVWQEMVMGVSPKRKTRKKYNKSSKGRRDRRTQKAWRRTWEGQLYTSKWEGERYSRHRDQRLAAANARHQEKQQKAKKASRAK